MSVVNCKVKFIRPKYDNLQEWVKDSKNVYIGRAGVVFIENPKTGIKERFPKQGSQFSNPFKIGRDGNRFEVLKKYEEMVIIKLSHDATFAKNLETLYGKNLGCWCHPEPCHGDVLLKIINDIVSPLNA